MRFDSAFCIHHSALPGTLTPALSRSTATFSINAEPRCAPVVTCHSERSEESLVPRARNERFFAPLRMTDNDLRRDRKCCGVPEEGGMRLEAGFVKHQAHGVGPSAVASGE